MTFPLGRAGIDSSRLSHLDLSMATISSVCLASLLSSCRLLQVIIALKDEDDKWAGVSNFCIWDFQKLALENCSLDAPAVTAIAQNSGLQVSEQKFARASF